MEFPCPSCEHPLSIRRDIPIADTSNALDTITGVDCPNCGFVPLHSIPDIASEAEDAPDRTLSYSADAEYGEDAQVSHFRLVRILGQGGFGNVWLADDINLDRQVALKLPISRNRDVASLLHEAKAAAHLRHPNIVSVYEVGTEGDQVFIACEYIEGMTLKDLLTQGRPNLDITINTLIAVCNALDHAHGQDIVHRDVKPANILLNATGQPFVTDFGLAKRVSAQSTESTISSEGQVLGTARYMSPEQASGKTKETDQRSDIYAIGVILFEMLTGHVPFRGNMRAVLHQKIFEDSPSPRTLDPTIPKDLETICMTCLEREPEKRYDSIGEVAEELRRFQAGEPILARPISSAERLWRWCRRHPMIAGLLFSLFLSLTVGFIGVSFYSIQSTRNAALLRQSLYRAQMTLAAEYVAHGDIEALKSSLKQAGQGDEATDLRGFEWYYYQHFVSPFLAIVDHGDLVEDVALSSDGKQIASVGVDREIRLWNSEDGKLLRSFTLDKGSFRAVDFSPTKGHLVAGASDGFVRIWNPAKEGGPLQQFKHGPPVAFVEVSPNGRMLMTAGERGAVRLWDVDAETREAEIPTGQSGTKSVQFTPDGKQVAIATVDGRVRLRDVSSKMIVKELSPNPHIERFAISDDGQTLVTANYEGVLRVWSIENETLLYSRETAMGLIGDLVFLKDSPLLAIVSTSRDLTIFDTVQRQIVRTVTSHYLTTGVIDRSHTGDRLAVGSGEGSVKLIDAEALSQPDVCWHDSHVRGVHFLDNNRLVAADGDGNLRIWNMVDGTYEDSSKISGAKLIEMACHPTSGLLAFATADPTIKVFDLNTGEIVCEPNVPDAAVTTLQFSADGHQLVIGLNDGTVAIVDPNDASVEIKRVTETDRQPTAVEHLSNDEVVVAWSDGQISLIDSTGKMTNDGWPSIDEQPKSLEICTATNVLAIGTDSGQLHLWDLGSQSMAATLRAHTSRINVLRALPNGKTIVSGGRDRELRMWDTSSAELLTSLGGHSRQIFSLSVSPYGQTLASGDLEGAIRIWRAPRTP